MLSNQVFYHETIRKLTAAFGTVFNDISIKRKDSENSVLKTLKIPFAYGSREKWLTRLEQESSISDNSKIQMTLPRIGFVLNGITFDSSRQLNPLNKFRKLNEGGNTLAYQYEKVPYNIDYTVSVYVKNTEDGLQIIEQILPYFCPQYNLTVIDNPDLSQKTDVPIVLTSVSNEDIFEGDYSTRRVLIWTLQFSMKAYLYRPTQTQGRIKEVILDYYVGFNEDHPNGARRVETYSVTPDPITAEYTDDYGFAETRVFYDEPTIRGADGETEYDISSSSSSSTADSETSSSSNSSSSNSSSSSSESESSSSSKSSNSSSSSSSSTEVSSTSSNSSSSSSSSTEADSTSSSNSSSSSSEDSETSSSSSTFDSESSSSEDSETSSSSSSSSSSSGDLNN